MKQLETEQSKTAKTVRTAIQKQHQEKEKQHEKSVSKEKAVTCEEALTYLSKIKLKLESARLTEAQIKEITDKLSAVYDYLAKLA